VLDLIVELHSAAEAVIGHARRDTGELRQRDHIRAALDALDGRWDGGPYGELCRRLVAEHAAGVERLVVVYDRLATHVLASQQRMVITHGEPHAGNVMISNGRHLLVDWDTALIATPERDLWDLDPGDGSVIDAYAAKTGTEIDRQALAFYKLWYDLDEICGYVSLLREEHTASDDIRESWSNLVHFLRPAERWPELMT
jgi:spectinomycin phosphotransferase